jgi:hypothetical protein
MQREIYLTICGTLQSESHITALLIYLFIHFGFSISNTYPVPFLVASVVINSNEGFFRNGKGPVLTVLSAGHALHVFINGQLSGQ